MAAKYIAMQGEEFLVDSPDIEGLKAELSALIKVRTLEKINVYKLDRTWKAMVHIDSGDELEDDPLPKADVEWCTTNEHHWRISAGHNEPRDSASCIRCGASYGKSPASIPGMDRCTGRRVKA